MRSTVLLLVFLPVLTADAGTKTPAKVLVSTSYRYAMGGLGTARSSTDSVQYIGCFTTARPTFQMVSCSARDVYQSASCFSTSPELVAAARALTPASFIRFHWDASGMCSEIAVATDSQYEPMK